MANDLSLLYYLAMVLTSGDEIFLCLMNWNWRY